MASGDDAGSFESTGLRPGEKRWRITDPKTGDVVHIIGPAENPDKAKMSAMAAQAFKDRQRISPADIADVPRGLAHGVISGLAGVAAPLARATQAEMGEVPTAPGVEQTTQILERQIPGGYVGEPKTGLGRMAERAGEFLADPSSWIGPGGPVIKAATAVTGAVGSYLGEKIGREHGHPVLGELAGSALAGGVTGFAALRGLPARPPRAVREATTQTATKGASKAAYSEMANAVDLTMDPMAVGQVKNAMIAQLTSFNPSERREVYDPEQIQGIMRIINNMTTPKSRRNSIAVIDLEHTRQLLNNERAKFGTVDAKAANEAIEILDELMLNLPGVAEVAERARKNWAAYKRGQIIEDVIDAAERRAKITGTGANADNVLRQEFNRRIVNKPRVWAAFSEREQQEIMKIIDPGKAINFARWVSRFGPRHIVTSALGGLGAREMGKEVMPGIAAAGAGAGAGHFLVHDPFIMLTTLTAGEIGHQVAERAQYGRAGRLAEITRARSPAGGYYTPRPLPSRTTTGIAGAGRALGATALSPDTTERLELPEIVVRPPQ
jgi:hypothetical protein